MYSTNTDPGRRYLNVKYCNENIKDAYHKLFDKAFARYSEKQNDLKGQKQKMKKPLA